MRLELSNMVNQINRVIIGGEDTLQYILVALLSEGHVLLEGLPGVGKTKLALALSKSIQARFKRIQFTPDTLPSDITGYYLYNRMENCMDYREGAACCNILLADEINRASPRVQSSLLEAMEERQITVEGNTIPLPNPFMVLATQNAIESEGTYPLPEAQLDRFFMKLQVTYPKRQDWKKIIMRYEQEDPMTHLEAVMALGELEEMKEEVDKVNVAEVIYDYILDISQEINHSDRIEAGINPRGTIALVKGAKAWAYLQGRTYVLPDDVKKVAIPILAHRIKLTGGRQSSHKETELMVIEALSRVNVSVKL